MQNEIRLKNLSVPTGMTDVVLDTDAYNEVDDQFAIAYLLKSKEKLNTKAIYAAPFFNRKVASPQEGMEKSYDEILNILKLTGEKTQVFKGSRTYLEDEKTPIISDAAYDLAKRVDDYSPENPLYIVAIGAITNIASAILLNSKVAENAVVVWLGGHAHHYHDTFEFNMRQDIAAARVVAKSGVPFVQLPCRGVVSEFSLSKPELDCWFKRKNQLLDYLTDIIINYMEEISTSSVWSKVIWDVTAVAWLLNDDEQFMLSRIISTKNPAYDGLYEADADGYPMAYVYHIKRDALMIDLINKITA